MLRCDTAPARAAQPAVLPPNLTDATSIASSRAKAYLTSVRHGSDPWRKRQAQNQGLDQGPSGPPKAIRDKRGFGPGAELIVEELPEGVLLRPSPKAGATRVEDVFGLLGPVDRIVSIEEINEGVLEEARRRWLRKTRDSD